MTVRVGQVWQEKDKRMSGRQVKVLVIADGKAIVGHPTITSVPKTRISIDRLPKAFTLVKDAPEAPYRVEPASDGTARVYWLNPETKRHEMAADFSSTALWSAYEAAREYAAWKNGTLS